MKDIADNVTLELIDAPKRGRGRPKSDKPAMTSAERIRLYRERHGLTTLTVELPSELVDQLNQYLQFKGVSKNEVIAKLLRTQLLRKR